MTQPRPAGKVPSLRLPFRNAINQTNDRPPVRGPARDGAGSAGANGAYMVNANKSASRQTFSAQPGFIGQSAGDLTPETIAEMKSYESYRPLTPEEQSWLARLNAQNPFFGPIDMAVVALASCPESFRLSPDYGVMLGMICAKFILEDRAEDEARLAKEQKRVTPALLNAFLKLCGPWTGFPPYACYFLLASLDVKIIFAMLVVWPRRWAVLRPFFLGVLKGFLIFPSELDPVWTDDMLDVLDGLTAFHRRPAHKGSSLF